jgi:Kdo2-lipid IVA lauroyltransferase/acyltransferase
VRRASLSHHAEFAALRSVIFLAERVGNARAERLGERLGLAIHRMGMRRDVTLENLRNAFPGESDEWIRDLARRCYAHMGREIVVTMRLQGTTPHELVRRSTVEGLDAVIQATESGQGAVLVTGHLGNWEVGAACLAARGLAMDVVMQRQSNPLADRTINANRLRLGPNPIDRKRASREGLRTLREGRVLGFVSDQDARSGGVFVPFFGRPASTHRGPALLALRTGAPLFAATGIRNADGIYDCRIQPINALREGDPDTVVARITAAYTAVFEDAIRSAPEQYLWQHRRWKSRPT